jgi:hypothetical protein
MIVALMGRQGPLSEQQIAAVSPLAGGFSCTRNRFPAGRIIRPGQFCPLPKPAWSPVAGSSLRELRRLFTR